MLSGFENPFHLLILLAVVLLVFGAKRVPEIGRSVGRGMREFKEAIVGSNAAELPSDVVESSAEPPGERAARADGA